MLLVTSVAGVAAAATAVCVCTSGRRHSYLFGATCGGVWSVVFCIVCDRCATSCNSSGEAAAVLSIRHHRSANWVKSSLAGRAALLIVFSLACCTGLIRVTRLLVFFSFVCIIDAPFVRSVEIHLLFL